MQASTRLTRLHRPAKSAGFTLIELLIVMVILGLLAALVGPKLFGHVDKAKIGTTTTQMGNIATALDAFRLDVGRYPTTEEGLAVLRSAPADDAPGASRWHGPYLKSTPKDAWGQDFHYAYPSTHGSDYDLSSWGADGKEGGEGNDADINNWEGAGADAPAANKDAAKP
ncbi:type II secretion system major pseudopilin GspG [Chitinimonas sp.]|uniref:type II secretion system major pseudopilin GspG n=1 Tax=Chitinimonas sp. TaxID=1934313 RepID=UPI0035B16CB4